ncbi:MAG: hypothetical protein ACI4HM_03305 [Ruminococcus sp.]
MSAKQSNIPKRELEKLASCFLPDIIAFFETEEGNREYEEWKRQREKENQANHKNIA